MKRTTIFAINNTLCNSIKVANLVLCSIVLFGSLMVIRCGSKHVDIYGMILYKFVRKNAVHFWVEYCGLIVEVARNEQRQLSTNLV
jgi:hypothetical protein